MEEQLIKKILPHSAEAEQSVIGAMIMDQEAILTASEILTSDDFYNPQFRTLYDAMLALYQEGKPVELKCHFCNSAYEFSTEDLKELLRKSK